MPMKESEEGWMKADAQIRDAVADFRKWLSAQHDLASQNEMGPHPELERRILEAFPKILDVVSRAVEALGLPAFMCCADCIDPHVTCEHSESRCAILDIRDMLVGKPKEKA